MARFGRTSWVAAGLAGWAGVCTAQVLSVPQKYQEQDSWCWAGCAQAVLEYYGCRVTQPAIAQHGTGGANTWNWTAGEGAGDDGLYRRGVDRILDFYDGIQSRFDDRALIRRAADGEMAAGRPVWLCWSWDSGGAHSVVLRGLRGDTAYLMDPWQGPTVNTWAWMKRGGGHTWTHTLRLTTPPPGRGDAYEPDNTRGRARRIVAGQVQRRGIHAAGNGDWAWFTLARPGRVVVRTGAWAGHAGGDTEMWLYRADGRQVRGGYSDDHGGTRWSRIEIPRLAGGRYYVRVREHGNDGKIAGYTLGLSVP